MSNSAQTRFAIAFLSFGSPPASRDTSSPEPVFCVPKPAWKPKSTEAEKLGARVVTSETVLD